jgi:uncharacterized protein YceK
MKLIAILIAAFLAGCASTAPPPKPDDGSRTVTVPAEMVSKCESEGGCALLTKEQLAELVELAQQVAQAQAAAGLDSNGCRKGSL